MFKSLFPTGEIVATPGALSVLEESQESVMKYLVLHLQGDWGCVCEEDKKMNTAAIQSGARILSAYILDNDTKIWVITEATDDDGNRADTTILLPDEY